MQIVKFHYGKSRNGTGKFTWIGSGHFEYVVICDNTFLAKLQYLLELELI